MTILSVKSIKGRREYMEDRYAYIEENGIIVAMVCDGHGGYEVAKETCLALPKLIHAALFITSGTNVKHAKIIRDIIIKWGEKMRNEYSGSTLTGVAIKDDTVYIYNIGDSRTCMGLTPGTFVYKLAPKFNSIGEFVEYTHIDFERLAFYCTNDHDSENHFEHNRVLSKGGNISENRLNGILSVTRALGDRDVGIGISYIPDIMWIKKSHVRDPIVMYSDGIYELQRYGTTANFNDDFLYYLGATKGAETLVDYAYNNGSDDNLTAFVISKGLAVL